MLEAALLIFIGRTARDGIFDLIFYYLIDKNRYSKCVALKASFVILVLAIISKSQEKMTDKQLRKPSKELTQILADNIRAYRIAENISQEELADICDLHRTYIGSVEREERNVTLSTLETLAKALKVSVPQLLTKRSFENDK